MPEIKRLGILGGTFNPPHIGHVAVASAAKAALGLERVLFIPAAQPPHKELPPGSASPEDRLYMTSLAAQGLPFAQSCDIELRRGGKSYTADTLAVLHDLYPGAQIWLICGGDMFLTLRSWRRADEIFRLCRIAALSREPGEREAIARYADVLRGKYGAGIDVIENEVIKLSSTELRAKLSRGEGDELLPPGVGEYIRARGLYGKDKQTNERA